MGVAWGYLPVKERLRTEEGEELRAQLSSGMATVTPAWHIQEVLIEDKLVAQREELERAIREQHVEPRPGEGAVPMGDDGVRPDYGELERWTPGEGTSGE